MWLRSVRATDPERRHALPGDGSILQPIGTLTHPITIRRPAHEVWPWLVQMGAGSRAGWYAESRQPKVNNAVRSEAA